MDKSYLEGLEWIVSGRAHVPGGVAVTTTTAESLWNSLVLGGWECPGFDEHIVRLRALPPEFPYGAEERADGTIVFSRR